MYMGQLQLEGCNSPEPLPTTELMPATPGGTQTAKHNDDRAGTQTAKHKAHA
jgi:hypothetical protein